MNSYDYIIIGQGLAGSILAYRLIKAKQKILVIDNAHHQSSSIVAAGIINPLTGYRLTASADFSAQLECSRLLYHELEQTLNDKFIISLDQYRLLKSDEQVKFWNKRVQHENFIPFTGSHHTSHALLQKNAFGVVEINQTVRIYTKTLLKQIKTWLIEQSAYQNEKLPYEALSIYEDFVSYGGTKAKKIIFCEGFQAIYNPFWQHLPFKLSKGEILTIQLEQEINALFNWRQWLLPQHGQVSDIALLGANYAWGDFSRPLATNVTHPTPTARDELLMRLASNTHLRGHVLTQQAGIRPTPTHRHPYIGVHKNIHNIYCFNGFGSKGCNTIPYYSQLFTQHLIHNAPLPQAVTQHL